jgi:hypothetical protein
MPFLARHLVKISDQRERWRTRRIPWWSAADISKPVEAAAKQEHGNCSQHVRHDVRFYLDGLSAGNVTAQENDRTMKMSWYGRLLFIYLLDKLDLQPGTHRSGNYPMGKGRTLRRNRTNLAQSNAPRPELPRVSDSLTWEAYIARRERSDLASTNSVMPRFISDTPSTLCWKVVSPRVLSRNPRPDQF